MIFGALGAGLREVFWLSAAERVVASYGESRLDEIQREKALARARLRASRRIANAPTAARLVGDALTHALAAAHRASEADGPFDARAALAAVAIDETDREAAKTVLTGELDALDFSRVETFRDRAEAVTVRVLRGVEARSHVALVVQRWSRIAAIFIVLALVARPFVRDRWLVHDVALHKPVTTSPLRPPPSTPEGVTDGRTRGTFAVQTIDGKNSFVMVDLERSYRVKRVRVFNRGDGWFDEILPLTLELSYDGTRFHEVARRTEHFDVWTVDLDDADARFVRVSKESGYIALTEIEVYARD